MAKKLSVAAILYTMEQNEPSAPFILELDCPDCPSQDEFEDALLKAYVEQLADMAVSVRRHGADGSVPKCITYLRMYSLGNWGWEVSSEQSVILVVSRPDSIS